MLLLQAVEIRAICTLDWIVTSPSKVELVAGFEHLDPARELPQALLVVRLRIDEIPEHLTVHRSALIRSVRLLLMAALAKTFVL